MKSIIYFTIFSGLFLFSQKVAIAQDADKTVTITVSGSGKSQEDARQSAFRSAIEQAFGAFISTKTEIFNDKVVADQIASVANGNIQSFSIINESHLPDSSWAVTLKALVSVSKLTSFVEAKGIEIEIKGGLFALNIKQQLLNEQGEIIAVCEMVGLLHELMQQSLDFTIQSGDPKSLDAESKNWEIPLVITATTNKNIDFCANYLIKTLSALSISSEEVTSYKRIDKPVFPFTIDYTGTFPSRTTFNLRKESSINALNTLFSNWEFYTRLFSVQTGMDEINVNPNGLKPLIHKFSPNDFLTKNKEAATFFLKDKRTLAQIEKMTDYRVKPRGIVSQFKHGGFVVYENNGHGLVAAITDIGNMDWNSAKNACDNLILNGYGDWNLPTKEELNALYVNLKKFGIGNFEEDFYWSSPDKANENYWKQNFQNGDQVPRYGNEYSKYNVRAVRSF